MKEFILKYKYWLLVAIAPISITLIFIIINKLRKKKEQKVTVKLDNGNVTLKYFQLSEFDSPDEKGSGSKMQQSTLQMLDKAREAAGVPFHINSGFRTQTYNDKLKDSVKNSAHLTGHAADIAVTDTTRKRILKALYAQGFRRFGIGSRYVHVDNDSTKNQAVWGYKGQSMPSDLNTLAKIAAL